MEHTINGQCERFTNFRVPEPSKINHDAVDFCKKMMEPLLQLKAENKEEIHNGAEG
jgi:hypothetical protein